MINNIGYICSTLQRQNGLSKKVAMRLIQSDLTFKDYTYEELDLESNRLANLLISIDTAKQDKVFILLPKQVEVFISFLGILKAQDIAGILFSNFGKEAIFERLLDSSAKVLITKKSLFNKIREIWTNLPALEKVILTDLSEHENKKILSYSELMASARNEFDVLPTKPDMPAILHYTSGSTGRPKGVLHVHGGIEHHIRTMEEVMQVEADDFYWCTADQGWVTGTTYGIIGPWAKGISQIHFAGNFNPVDWFEILDRQKVNIWYTAPTALRMLMREESKIIGKYELPSLKRVYSVGEPLNPEIIHWVNRHMKKEIYDTWFQTETGGIMIANRPGMEIKPGSMGKPVGKISAIISSDSGKELPAEDTGNLRIRKGWPSMFRAYLNMDQQYQKKFHGNYYDTGDLAKKDQDGYFWFIGRNDDVINTSGHLVGPFEIESSLLELEEIVDVAIIGAPDEMLFEKIIAYVSLKSGLVWSKSLEVKCRIQVSTQISPIAVPSEFYIIENIPKNRSGKIMRRVLKARYLNHDVGDISTMEE